MQFFIPQQTARIPPSFITPFCKCNAAERVPAKANPILSLSLSPSLSLSLTFQDEYHEILPRMVSTHYHHYHHRHT